MPNVEHPTSNIESPGEGGIRTLGSLLGYGALAKRCFQPLSHLTKKLARISRRIVDCQPQHFTLWLPGWTNMEASPEFRTQCFGVRCVFFTSLSAHCDADCQKRREDALALLMLRKNQQYYLPIFVGHLK